VIPEAVTENSKGYLLVNNDPIIWTMRTRLRNSSGRLDSSRVCFGRRLQLCRV